MNETRLCYVCGKEVPMMVTNVRSIYFGFVWTLRCAKKHWIIEWRKEGTQT